jgi:hypothetical protein
MPAHSSSGSFSARPALLERDAAIPPGAGALHLFVLVQATVADVVRLAIAEAGRHLDLARRGGGEGGGQLLVPADGDLLRPRVHGAGRHVELADDDQRSVVILLTVGDEDHGAPLVALDDATPAVVSFQ